MAYTRKQFMLIDVIVTGNEGEPPSSHNRWCDTEQILDRLERRHGWKTSRVSLYYSIRALEKHGLIVRGGKKIRRGRSRQTFCPTPTGISMKGAF